MLFFGKGNRIDTGKAETAELRRKGEHAVASVEARLAVLAHAIEVRTLLLFAHHAENLQIRITFTPHAHFFGARLCHRRQPRANTFTPRAKLGVVQFGHGHAPSVVSTVQALMPGAPYT